jgi:hypothetical protein
MSSTMHEPNPPRVAPAPTPAPPPGPAGGPQYTTGQGQPASPGPAGGPQYTTGQGQPASPGPAGGPQYTTGQGQPASPGPAGGPQYTTGQGQPASPGPAGGPQYSKGQGQPASPGPAGGPQYGKGQEGGGIELNSRRGQDEEGKGTGVPIWGKEKYGVNWWPRPSGYGFEGWDGQDLEEFWNPDPGPKNHSHERQELAVSFEWPFVLQMNSDL